jgi:hypothetical protein
MMFLSFNETSQTLYFLHQTLIYLQAIFYQRFQFLILLLCHSEFCPHPLILWVLFIHNLLDIVNDRYVFNDGRLWFWIHKHKLLLDDRHFHNNILIGNNLPGHLLNGVDNLLNRFLDQPHPLDSLHILLGDILNKLCGPILLLEFVPTAPIAPATPIVPSTLVAGATAIILPTNQQLLILILQRRDLFQYFL